MAAAEQSKGGSQDLGTLDRLLSIVTEVRAGEAATALLMALNVLLLLSAYYFIKPVREALILSTGGAELKSYASAGQTLTLAVVIPIYGQLVDKVPRQRLIPAVTLFFMACLGAFAAAALANVPYVGVAFYLFAGVFNLMIVAQFWAFAADIYTQEQGERLFPAIAVGASLGAVVGSGLATTLAEWMAPEMLLVVGAAVLGVTILITKTVERRMKKERQDEPGDVEAVQASPENGDGGSRPDPHEEGQGENPFLMVLKNRYLLLIAALMVLANVVNTTGEFILGSLVETWAKETSTTGVEGQKQAITIFYGSFFFFVNTAGFLIQALLVSRIIRWFGVRGAILFLPVIAFASYLVIALVPVIGIVRWMKTAENSTDYSLNNTVRNTLFLPLTPEEKYKAKQAIDTFFVRGGDLASAGVVYLGLNVLSWSEVGFAWFNVVIVAIWLAIAVAIGRRYVQLSQETAKS